MKILLLSLLLVTIYCEGKPALFRIPLTRVERTTTEKKLLFEFLTTHQNYFIDEDDPELKELLDWKPPSDEEIDEKYKETALQPEQNEDTAVKAEKIEAKVEKVATEDNSRLKPQVNGGAKSKIHLQNFKNTQYLGEIKVGQQLEPFTVIYDTGSANMWLNSKRCNDPGCLNHRQFDPFHSSSYSETGFDLDVQFGTGGLKGFMGQDQVEIGGVPVQKQDFAEIVKEEGAVFEASKFDGIVGLAYPSMAAYDLNPVFDNVIQQKKLSSNIFTFMLDRNEGGSGSELILGGVDETQIEGEMKWHKVVDKYYWMIQAEKILLDGKDTGLCNNCNVIADTGTSLITGPMNELMTLLNSIQVDDDCNNAAQAPVLTFVIDGIHYDLTSHDYMMKVDDDDNEEPYSINAQMGAKNNGFLSMTQTKSSCKCTGAFMPLDIPEPQGPAWILGDIFLSKYVSSYDRDRNMVGFAKSKRVK